MIIIIGVTSHFHFGIKTQTGSDPFIKLLTLKD